MEIIKLMKGSEAAAFADINNRKDEDFFQIDQRVSEILNRVRKDGDQGLLFYSRELDHVDLEDMGKGLKVTAEEVEEAYRTIEPDALQALQMAAEHIADFHQRQKEETWTYEKEDGTVLGQLVLPMESVGVYIPGGKAAYPSTVLMNVIPAKIAGVERIVMVTPPQKDGCVNPYILAAAKIAGADEIYRIGGAQAVGALAYGTETIKPVCKITGPGNIYVARAKKAVFGTVNIDMIAGPSEICIIADSSADPRFIAADLLSQAEHDEMAASVLITTSEELAKLAEQETMRQLSLLARESIARASIERNGRIFVAEDLDSCFDAANSLAPEHLELLLEEPKRYLGKVRNAGAVFLGKYSPEPVGDYMAGPNHTLPTSGTARFASPLGVYDFVKKTSIVAYTQEALSAERDSIMKLAEKEGLTAHRRAVEIRFDK